METETSIFQCKHTLTCKGKVLDLKIPLVMGVINVTPDSFYGASQFRMRRRIKRRAQEILEQGGTIIDVGACSTRPGSSPVTEEEELKRLDKALSTIRKHFPSSIVSVDTFRSGIAKRVVKEFGVNIINDISAGDMDPVMFETVAEVNVPYIVMHMKGNPQNMQKNPLYENVVKEVLKFFTTKIEKLKMSGVNDILIDPGFGFGKTIEHNYTLLKNLDTFRLLDFPLVVGLSRKSMIYNTLNTNPEGTLTGTTVLNTLALLRGAKILRVHDVKDAVEAIKLVGITEIQPIIE